jgi:hypothetical protein
MKRRNFIALVGGAAGYAFLRPDVARTETVGPKPRIGMLWHAGSAEEEAVYLAAFRQGLADFGYLFRTFANVQTAKALGLTIQPTVLVLADQVIE